MTGYRHRGVFAAYNFRHCNYITHFAGEFPRSRQGMNELGHRVTIGIEQYVLTSFNSH